MILLDPDLDPDPAPGPNKRTPPLASRTDPRDFRMPSARALARFQSEAQSLVRLRGQVTVLLTTDAAIRRMNKQFRGKDKSTDVLSFPAAQFGAAPAASQVAGDLAISVSTALRQAREQGHSLATEIKVLMLHGLLHLAGYDHETDAGEMARRERLLRGKLKLPQGLIERASGDAASSISKLARKSQRKAGAPDSAAKKKAAKTAVPAQRGTKGRRP